LLKGFSVTLKHLFKPRFTVNYPEERRWETPIFRGRHRQQRYADGLERCVGCCLCAAVCPSEAIYVEAAENTPDRRVSAGERYASVYEIHLLRCIFCGFCEEACPEDAIVMGPWFELADNARGKLILKKEQMLVSLEEGFGAYPWHPTPTLG
jgi:NADH-quinone oxidoreductase subunit I